MAERSRITPRHELLLAAAGLASICVVHGSALFGSPPDPARWAEASAYALLLVGVTLARDMGGRFATLLERLVQRDVLPLSPERHAELLQQFQRNAVRFATLGGLGLPTVLAGAYLWLGFSAGDWPTAAVALELLAAFVAGRYAGRAICYGTLGARLRSAMPELRIKPGHPDGAAGLKPVGEFFVHQAGVIMLPAIFFAFWLIATPMWTGPEGVIGENSMTRWLIPYRNFLLLAIAVEVLVFVAPMWLFHCEMVRQKSRHLVEADGLADQLIALKAELAVVADPSAVESLQDRVERIAERIDLMEGLPTWPLDAGIRRHFAFKNGALLLTMAAGKYGEDSDVLKEVLGMFAPG